MSEPLQFPVHPADWTGWLAAQIDAYLAQAETGLTELKDGTRRSTDEVLSLWNDADIALRNAHSLASVFAEVHPDEAVRTLAERRAQDISRILTDRGLDRGLYEVVEASADEGDDQARRLRRRTLRDFHRSGVDRDERVRARLREISERLTVLDQDFGRAIRDDVRSITVRPEQLDGLPEDFIAAHPVGDDGLITVTTDYPDAVPVRTFAHDEDVRARLIFEFLNRAWPQNDAVLKKMLDLRAEQAKLLGYPDWPDFDAEVKMIGSGDAILEFVDKVSAAAAPRARRELDALLERRRRDDPSATEISRPDLYYYEELVRREHYDVDGQQVRRYFDFARVRAGLLDTTAKLFGVEYRQCVDVPLWHEDVFAYDVAMDGEPIGRIYLDLHPRDGKFKHAAQFDLRGGVTGRQLPEGVLVCNFPRGLMEHSQVVTLFHEFGHLVHHILAGRQRWIRFSGVATEWDFVEAPSQMLEEWAWDPDILQGFAVDAEGGPIPRELVARMRDADNFGKGTFVRTQLFFAALSYLMHRDCPDDLTEMVKRTQADYDDLPYLADTHFHTSFGHLAGYTSAYYTYLWSLVIAKDLFSAFDRNNMFEPAVAHRYRDTVLARGGTDDAANLVTDFLGRPYSFDAFTKWLETAT